MTTKESYLEEKLSLSSCSFDHKQEKKICKNCWFSYKGVFKESRFILECRTCLDDTSRFSSILRLSEAKPKVVLKIKCGNACIWFDWFHKKRLSSLKKSQQLVYEKEERS